MGSIIRDMILSVRENLGFKPRLRLGIVAGLVLTLLAFPCGPLAAALGSDTGHALPAAKTVPAHSGPSDTECPHPVKKHESSCCNECSSWLTARFNDTAAVILNSASYRDLPAVALTYKHLSHAKPDRDPRLTGPPSVAFVDGTSLYSKTQRYRI